MSELFLRFILIPDFKLNFYNIKLNNYLIYIFFDKNSINNLKAVKNK